MKNWAILLAIVCAITAAATPAPAWGPATREAIVTTAMHVLSKEGAVQLDKLDKDIRDGATLSAADVAKLLPALASGPVQGIESEMNLLETVRGNVIDPYFAFRLGVLGGLVANATAPLSAADPTYRNRYYADVDAGIRRVPLKTSARKQVDAAAYLERARLLANARTDLILKDYQSGVGFNGVAKAALPDDVSRSIDAVADVWSTIVTGTAVHANVSDAQVREYVFNAMSYYVNRHNAAEIDATYRRLSQLTAITPDLAKRIGDMFFDGGYYDLGIEEFTKVLAAEPGRKDVLQKIAAYYSKVGDDALAESHLQQAYDAYAKAAQTDPLHSDAEAKRLKVEGLIAQRTERLNTMRKYIDDAAQLQNQAEQFALQKKYADALTALKQAEAQYAKVSDEFPTEMQAATAGMANVTARLQDLKKGLIQNAQSLSGSGFTFDMQQAAAAGGRALDTDILRKFLDRSLNTEIAGLKTEYQPVLDAR